MIPTWLAFVGRTLVTRSNITGRTTHRYIPLALPRTHRLYMKCLQYVKVWIAKKGPGSTKAMFTDGFHSGRGELYFSNMRHQCAGLNVVWATFCPMWLDSGLKHTREGIPGDNTDDTCLDLCIPLLPLHEGEVGWNFGQDCSSKTLAYASRPSCLTSSVDPGDRNRGQGLQERNFYVKITCYRTLFSSVLLSNCGHTSLKRMFIIHARAWWSLRPGRHSLHPESRVFHSGLTFRSIVLHGSRRRALQGPSAPWLNC